MCYRPAEAFVKRFLEPVFATVEAPKTEASREEMPAALGEQGKYDASVSAAIINGKFGLHIPYEMRVLGTEHNRLGRLGASWGQSIKHEGHLGDRA